MKMHSCDTKTGLDFSANGIIVPIDIRCMHITKKNTTAVKYGLKIIYFAHSLG